MFKNKLPLDLQLFADDPEGSDNKDQFTPEEVAKQIEDAKSAAKAEAQAEFDKLLAEKLEASKTEAEKLAKMNADEKRQHELEQRESALATKEQDIALRELKAETLKTLTDKGLPTSVLDLVLGQNAEDTAKNVDNFKTTFDSAVQEVVDERLRGKSPVTSSKSTTNTGEDQARAAFAAALKGV